MPGKTPNSNGRKPVENGVQKNGKDADKSAAKGKPVKKGTKEGEDMTVVVPPSKNAKQSSAPPPADAEGDVNMEDSDKTEEELEVKVDPVTQTISGKSSPHVIAAVPIYGVIIHIRLRSPTPSLDANMYLLPA